MKNTVTRLTVLALLGPAILLTIVAWVLLQTAGRVLVLVVSLLEWLLTGDSRAMRLMNRLDEISAGGRARGESSPLTNLVCYPIEWVWGRLP